MKQLEKNSIQEFNLWAEDYDKKKKWQFFFSNKGILNILDLKPNSTFLDVGCATGTLLNQIFLLNRKITIYGIDISPEMVKVAQSKLGDRAKIQEGSASKLPYKNNFFDCVTCATSFHHYPDPQEALNEMYRVLKPTGKLLLLDPFTDGPLRKIFCNILDVIFQEKGTHLFTRKQMYLMFSTAGFNPIHQQTYLQYKLITSGKKPS